MKDILKKITTKPQSRGFVILKQSRLLHYSSQNLSSIFISFAWLILSDDSDLKEDLNDKTKIPPLGG